MNPMNWADMNVELDEDGASEMNKPADLNGSGLFNLGALIKFVYTDENGNCQDKVRTTHANGNGGSRGKVFPRLVTRSTVTINPMTGSNRAPADQMLTVLFYAGFTLITTKMAYLAFIPAADRRDRRKVPTTYTVHIQAAPILRRDGKVALIILNDDRTVSVIPVNEDGEITEHMQLHFCQPDAPRGEIPKVLQPDARTAFYQRFREMAVYNNQVLNEDLEREPDSIDYVRQMHEMFEQYRLECEARLEALATSNGPPPVNEKEFPAVGRKAPAAPAAPQRPPVVKAVTPPRQLQHKVHPPPAPIKQRPPAVDPRLPSPVSGMALGYYTDPRLARPPAAYLSYYVPLRAEALAAPQYIPPTQNYAAAASAPAAAASAPVAAASATEVYEQCQNFW